MKLAYLILCHTDAEHINRLANKLANENTEIYIHVDLKSDLEEFKSKILLNENIHFIKDRVRVFWGGYSQVQATINLMDYAYKNGKYDRYILLQGLDYPLASNKEIENFFNINKNTEFIRGCNITNSTEKYFYSKCKYYWFFDNINIAKRIFNRISNRIDLKIRKGWVRVNSNRYDLYWGSAQWALTDKCVKYILEFNKEQKKFNKYLKNTFPVDEIYFNSIIFNSNYRFNTVNKGPEKNKKYLVNWRNLHYFEYEKSIKVFNENDYNNLRQKKELFIRKTTTKDSSQLLDIIDKSHSII